MATTNGDVWDESRRLGQLFMMGFDGTSINDQVRVLIQRYHVGSILLTAKNLKSAAQSTQLVLDLQELARDAGHPVPLLIAIDQENGGVNSLYDETFITQFPSAMGIAATGSKKLAKDIARATAQELTSCGVNWIMGPVLDVLTNARNQPLGVRSLGDDPQEVSALGAESIRGYREGGLATCGKHFPSYGNLEFLGAPTDLPTITESLENLSHSALVPFRNAITLGIDAMMVGGVAMSSSSVNVMHACLSEEIVGDLLRHELRFDGVVVSECLEMEALSRNIGISGGTVMAFKAGCDVILTCRSLSAQEEAINGLRAGLDNGMIERFRVQESVQRILKLKAKYTSWEKALHPAGIDNLSLLHPSHITLSTSAYNKSITLVRDTKRWLPLSNLLKPEDEVLLLTPLVQPLPASSAHKHAHELASTPGAEYDARAIIMSGERVFREFGRALARHHGGKTSHTSYTANGVRPIHEQLLERAHAMIVVTADAGRNMYQQAFAKHINMLCKLLNGPDGTINEKPCIVVAVSSPFDFVVDSSISTYVCTYDFTDIALLALVKILFGELTPTGTLPGSFKQAQKQKSARQQWLVESFNEERDLSALDALIEAVKKQENGHSTIPGYATGSTFLLRNATFEEAHFVVRNSSTKELFGFVATYFVSSSKTGHIAAILVEPTRRKRSIGHSLHDRSVRALLQKKGIKRFQLGSIVPSIYPGIPRSLPNQYKHLRQWFAKLGWTVTKSQTICSMVVHDLAYWTAPEGLGKSLANPEVKYDLVTGNEYFDAVLEHVKVNAKVELHELYKIALQHKEGTSLVRARRATDGSLLGTVITYRSDSILATYIPEVASSIQDLKGAITLPVLSASSTDKALLFQGLILISLRQLKRQGVSSASVHHVTEEASLHSLEELGFEFLQSFDQVSGSAIDWSMMPPT